MLLYNSFHNETGVRRVGLNLLSWTWCLPSTLLGLGAAVLAQGTGGNAVYFKGSVVIRWKAFRPLGGVCLGQVIVVSDQVSEEVILHEWGHFRQCLLLGPLYYLVIGIPSVAHAIWFRQTGRPFYQYYHFYTEAWADALGGVYSRHQHRYPHWTGYLFIR
jgi:hypothetical protein